MYFNIFISLFIQLCKDETPMVRRAASANLGVRINCIISFLAYIED